MDQPNSAILCIQEATNIFALSHHIMYTVCCLSEPFIFLSVFILYKIIKILVFQRGLLHEHKQEFVEAKLCYQNALAIHPTHMKSMQHLVSIYPVQPYFKSFGEGLHLFFLS